MMAIAFRFRFQRVLDVREAVERQRMLALSAELARHEEALASLEAWRTRLRQSEEALRSLYLGRPLVAQAVARELLHREGLRARVAEAERTVEESEAAYRGGAAHFARRHEGTAHHGTPARAP